MRSYKIIKPIVPGVFDNQTSWIGEENKRYVKDIGIIFDEYPNQDLYTNYPIYFVSKKFKTEYENSSLSGILKFSLIRSLLFENESSPKNLKEVFFEIVINSDLQKQTDFLKDRTKLLLNEEAIEFINHLNCDEASIEDYDPNWHSKLLEEDRKKREIDSNLLSKITKWFK